METVSRKPNIIVFASGTKDGGGSGFKNLVLASQKGVLDATIVAVVSNHQNGGVSRYARELGIPFIYFSDAQDASSYRQIVENTGTTWVALSGWLKKVVGLDPRRTFNIHPALLTQLSGRFGGKGMYGIRVHKAVQEALLQSEINCSGASMHFVSDEYDKGPIFFEKAVELKPGATAEEIQCKVQQVEHKMQPQITNLVVHGKIAWDGKNPNSIIYPPGYKYRPGAWKVK